MKKLKEKLMELKEEIEKMDKSKFQVHLNFYLPITYIRTFFNHIRP